MHYRVTPIIEIDEFGRSKGTQRVSIAGNPIND